MYSIRGVSAEVKAVEEQKFQKDLCASLRDSEDLLRSMAPFSFPFSITNVDLKMSLDLVSFMFESVWFHFSALAEALLSAQADVYVQSKAVDILVHSLTSAIFLDLKEKRLLLADLLLAFRKKLEATKHRKDPNRKIPDESWYDDAVNAFPPAALTTISKLHHLTVYIKDHILEVRLYSMYKFIYAIVYLIT
ncbi:hypothetical protein B484DRAFT_252382 [Ochromonadaceae sp. CCMP2298]|nr:hypothetical protein B484DRAFT_252382 [Ochromonadaceae sp. CCMP2298]